MTKRARDLHDDPLSAASLGLVALGIDRARRIDVLEVLACLIDHADFTGSVVLDQELFFREEALGVNKCLDAYAILEQLDVVSRTDQGWTIADFRWHAGPVGETEASVAVLRKHLASVGVNASDKELADVAFEHAPVGAAVAVTAPVIALTRWRRAVPVAAGIAASAAAIVGISQFVPQAAVTGRNAALTAAAPTSAARSTTARAAGGSAGAGDQSGSNAAPKVTSALAATATTNATGPGIACLVPKVASTITSIEVVPLALAGNNGQTIWAAVIKGTTTLTDSESSLVLPALNVVAHVAGGDTDPVQATLAAPVLLPHQAAAFNAVIALGDAEPTSPVTATAAAMGMPTC